jgi:hypothetical protein
MPENLKKRLLATLPRHLLIDLFDMAASKALQAYELVRDGADLDTKRANEAVGQLRFRMQEKGFVETCALHGGLVLPDGVIPGVSARTYQPFVRFGEEGPGVILGLATMPSAGELPAKNRSRLAGVMLNTGFNPGLFDEPGPQPGDIFVLFLVARDRANPGLIDEIGVGVIDDAYNIFVFYEPIDQFLAGYGPDGAPAAPEDPHAPTPSLVRLKRARKPFKPPEQPNDDDADDKADDRKGEG